MRWLETPPNTGAYNMALDEALLICLLQGTSPPTLRTYRWTTPNLSIGAFQSAARELDLEEAHRLKMPWVRRPTGGGAVLHGGDLTCSLVAPMELLSQEASIKASYQKISLAFRASLARLGVQSEIAAEWQGEQGRNWRGPCFGSIAPFEISVQGRKLMGHSQRVKGSALLQQSSLLIRNQQAELAPFLKTQEEPGEPLPCRLNGRAIGLEELLREPPSYEKIGMAFKEGLQEALGTTLEEGEVSEQEDGLARQLVKDKYDTPGWNLRL